MSEITARTLPEQSLLMHYKVNGDYTDCFTVDVEGTISQQQFVTAFYTSRLFKVERFILRWLVNKPSSDRQAANMATGAVNAFAAWTVEGRMPEQLLLCDYQGRTRSWLMVEALAESDRANTRLLFGTAVVSVTNARTRRKYMPFLFRVLAGFHRLYAKALLRSALAKLVLR